MEQEHEDAVLRDDPNGPTSPAFHALLNDAGWNTLLDGILQLESVESSALAALYNATEQRLQAAEDALYGSEERRRNVTHAVAELQHMWAELQALAEAIHPMAMHRKAFNESDMPLLGEDLDTGRLFAADSKQPITNSSMSPYERVSLWSSLRLPPPGPPNRQRLCSVQYLHLPRHPFMRKAMQHPFPTPARL